MSKEQRLEGKPLIQRVAYPTLREVRIYFSEKEMPENEADAFFTTQTKKYWTSKKGKPLSKWKAEAFKWIASVLKVRPWLYSRKVH
jgi:hypothetical protein